MILLIYICELRMDCVAFFAASIEDLLHPLAPEVGQVTGVALGDLDSLIYYEKTCR